MFRPNRPVMMFAALALAAGPALADQWELEASHASVTFKVKHLDVGYTHGRFNEVAGNLDTTDPAFKFTVPTASVDTNNAKRDDHLRSPDFFNAKQFPVIEFAGAGVKQVEGGLELSGQMSLHGVSQPLTVQLEKTGEADDPWGNHRIGFTTTFTVKRSDYGMTEMLDAVGDEVTLTIAFEAIRQ